MVNFEGDSTVSTPPLDVLKIIILQRRNYVADSWEATKKKEHRGSDIDLANIKAGLFSLFLEIQPMAKRKMLEEEYNELKKKITVDLDDLNEVETMAITIRFNELLDEAGLTKIDNKKIYDSTICEIENEEKGL